MKRILILCLVAFATFAEADDPKSLGKWPSLRQMSAYSKSHGGVALTFNDDGYAVVTSAPSTDIPKRHWLTYEEHGVIRMIDRNGELVFLPYTQVRGLVQGGHRVMEDGHTIMQVRLLNGQWIDLIPQ